VVAEGLSKENVKEDMWLKEIGIGHEGFFERNRAIFVVGASRGKMPLGSNGVGINSRRVHAESVVSAFQHIHDPIF